MFSLYLSGIQIFMTIQQQNDLKVKETRMKKGNKIYAIF